MSGPFDLVELVHMGLGEVGAGVAELTSRQGFRSVAAVEIRPDLVGQPLSVVAPSASAEVLISDRVNLPEPERPRVAIVASAWSLEDAFDGLAEVIDAGCHVVATVPDLAFPWHRLPDLAERIDRMSRAKGVAVLSTGVNPGLVEYVTAAVAGAMARVDHVQVERICDVTGRGANAHRAAGYGLDAMTFDNAVKTGRIGHPWLIETAAQIAAVLRLPLGSTEVTVSPVSGVGTDAAPSIIGVRNELVGSSGSREVIRLVVEFSVGPDTPRDEIVLSGDPEVRLVVPGGLDGDLATIRAAVNAIHPVLSCTPGLHQVTDLPPFPPSGAEVLDEAAPVGAHLAGTGRDVHGVAVAGGT